jgi:hypothetical protein
MHQYGVKHADLYRQLHHRGLRRRRLSDLDLSIEVVNPYQLRERMRDTRRRYLSDTQTLVQKYATMVAVQTLLANCTVDLVAASFAPSATIVIGSLTIATFTGYAQVAITSPAAPFYDEVAGGVSIALPATFTCTGTAVSNTIYGYVLQTATPAIVQTGLLAAPIGINAAHQAIPLTVVVNLQ